MDLAARLLCRACTSHDTYDAICEEQPHAVCIGLKLAIIIGSYLMKSVYVPPLLMKVRGVYVQTGVMKITLSPLRCLPVPCGAGYLVGIRRLRAMKYT